MLFEISTKTYCGFGITKKVLPELLVAHRPLFVIDRAISYKTEYPSMLAPAGEPTYRGLGELRSNLQDRYDCVVAIGGGSAMDYGKAIAALYNSPGPGLDFRGFDKIQVPGIPCICIPTTAGTGSEVTPNAVFTDLSEQRKLGINGRHMRATYAILDAEWTLTCPYSVALSSLLDAFVHAVESYMAPEATPLTRALSREAFRLLYQNALSIKPCPEGSPYTPYGEQQRQSLLYGAYLAAMALSNSGSGVVGAMSYPLGVHFGIPHGYAGGIFLPDIVEHNIKQGYYFDELMITPGRGPYQFAYMLGDLWKRLEVPNFKQWIKPDGITQAWRLMEDINFEGRNPCPFTHIEAQDFIKRHM